ncbi:MAG: Sec-independent protein translocase subunit TatA [Halothiobacillaceae bacterium]|jgi:sec-independent protein translocase protein TatA|nr:Sec-independent protein translocase subunit TatA [Halothiobacillaceae bacterium]MDY0049643.1 Sec-independent protein translocase subunit TatA [Halothiobacillaceae bacterium]
MGAFSIWHLLVILVIVVLLFGTKRLRNVGTDLGNAIKSFRTAVKDEDAKAEEAAQAQNAPQAGAQNLPPQGQAPAQNTQQAQAGRVIDGEATRDTTKS